MASNILVCTQCGYTGDPKSAIKGSGCLEVTLWLLFIIPGLLYSIWRSSSRHKVCPECKSPSLIPITSPKAKKIMEENMSKEDIDKAMASEQKKVTQQKKNERRMIIWTVVIIVIFITLMIIVS